LIKFIKNGGEKRKKEGKPSLYSLMLDNGKKSYRGKD
jgi:hypothetical protein